MPSPSTANLPPPKSADEFDQMTEDALRERHGRVRLMRFGRSGQAQGGIDGFDQADPSFVWQATTEEPSKLLAKLESDLKKLHADPDSTAEVFAFVVSSKRDAQLQREVRKISASRVLAGKCQVDIVFWDDVCQALTGNEKLFAKHFPALANPRAAELIDLQADALRYTQEPDLHLRYAGGTLDSTARETWKVEVRNVGLCTVELVQLFLQWSLRGAQGLNETSRAQRNIVLAPNESTPSAYRSGSRRSLPPAALPSYRSPRSSRTHLSMSSPSPSGAAARPRSRAPSSRS
jgi:hypothetical protein